MKRKRLSLFFIVTLVFLTHIFVDPIFAQEKKKMINSEQMESENKAIVDEMFSAKKEVLLKNFPGFSKRISIDLRDISIIDALKFLAYEGDLNILTAKDVAGVINLLIEDVRLIDAFIIILSSNQLAYDVNGKMITVMPNAQYKQVRGVDFFDVRETYVCQLKYASASNLGALLGNVKSDVGKIVFDDSTGILILTDTPEKIEEMKDIISKSDISTISRQLPLETESFELKYAKVEDIKPEIEAAITPEVGAIRTDIRTNSFVISDLPFQLEKIKKIIGTFDRKTREVFIEAKIVQVTLSDTNKWGIDWETIFSKVGGNKNLSMTPSLNMPASLTTFGKLTIANAGSSNLSAILEILQTVGETKILSNPHIATEEGKKATINVITKQPYPEGTTTTTDAGISEAVEYQFVEVGVKLDVTPTINSDGFISMLIKPEVSSITSFYPDSTSASRVPVVETANAETTVLIKDGTTIIIAGMIKDSKTKTSNKVPLLGDIPVLGKAFSNVSDEISRTETVVFLTPTIISGSESYLLERDKEKQIKGLRQ